MQFDLVDLRLFVQVVEAGSLTGGAARSHMTLASASERVRSLEARLRQPLLVRHAQGVRPTEAGHTLLRHARQMLAQLAALQADLAPEGRELQGRLRLLCNTAAIAEHLPLPLARFLAAHPGLSIDLEERASDDIADLLREGRAELGVISDAADTEGLQTRPFVRDDLVLVMPRGDALAGRRRVALADAAAGRELIGLAEGHPLQELVGRELRRAGRRPVYRLRVPDFEALCRVCAEGVGIGVLPAAAAARHAPRMKLSRTALSDGWAARRLLCAARDAHALPLAARRLLDHLAPGRPWPSPES